MTSNQPSGNSHPCKRCGQALAAGTNYCVSCGFQDIDAVYATRIGADSELEKRRGRLSFFKSLFRFGGIFRIFR